MFATLAIPFPHIDPVLVSFGPIAIRWYALAYVAGLLIGWRVMVRLAERPGGPPGGGNLNGPAVDDFLIWATLGVILGGRLGYVIFYNPEFFLEHPARILAVWQGGMSFHGGLAGVIGAIILFARLRRIPVLALGDLVAFVAPIGLFFGRIANFINGELYGRVSDVPWAMVFPGGGPEPRHPSQLYQAGLEGVVLFVLLWGLLRLADARAQPGLMTGAFLAGYGILRPIGEMFRQPDAHIGFLAGGATMGQLLSVPLLLAGIAVLWIALRRPPRPGA